MERADEPSGVQVGARAPEFHGSAPRQIQGSNLQGELVLVYFWANWCSVCAEEIGEIQRLHETYDERGLEVIGVSIDLDPRDMQEFQENHPTTFLNFWDLDVINVNTWEPSGMSAIYLVNKDSTVTFVHTASDHEGHPAPDFLALEELIKASLE